MSNYWKYEDCWEEEIAEIFPNLANNELVKLFSASLFDSAIFLERPINDLVSEIKLSYKNNKRIFVFSCMRESLILPALAKFTKIINEVNLSDAEFIWLTGDPAGVSALNKYFPNKKFSVLESYYFEYIAQKIFPKYTKNYVPGQKEKTFLCFNNVIRSSRVELLEYMIKYDLVKDAYYSFLGSSRGTSSTDELVSLLQMSHNYPNIIKNKHILPLKINDTLYNGELWMVDLLNDDVPFYENSYFSVVTETIFYDVFNSPPSYIGHVPALAGKMITEKTYKSIAMKHPFILLARPFTLQMLRDRGYKTFNSFIDESYDEIVDDTLRLKAVADEINRLAKSDLVKFTHHVKDIVEYNAKHFWSQTIFDPNKIKT